MRSLSPENEPEVELVHGRAIRRPETQGEGQDRNSDKEKQDSVLSWSPGFLRAYEVGDPIRHAPFLIQWVTKVELVCNSVMRNAGEGTKSLFLRIEKWKSNLFLVSWLPVLR